MRCSPNAVGKEREGFCVGQGLWSQLLPQRDLAHPPNTPSANVQGVREGPAQSASILRASGDQGLTRKEGSLELR